MIFNNFSVTFHSSTLSITFDMLYLVKLLKEVERNLLLTTEASI
jgi:hypothetical protein